MQKKHISSKSARHLRSALWNKLTVKRTSTGSRATSACLYNVDWELITKVNLRFVLSTLQAVNHAGLITLTTACSSCSPSTETYLAPGDCTQWQPAESSSSSKPSPQYSVVTCTPSLISPCCSGKARWGCENSHNNWRQALLWSLMDLFCY